ncbi:MAG: HU family DNA-binding protein [Candidatus Hydrogenedentota bacterium]
MTKRELVIRVANKLGMTQSTVAKIIEGTFDTISQTLAEGKRWELRDFGVFEVKTRASRIGRNPRTGEQVPVPERKVVTFRPGKKMKELVSRTEPAEPAEPISQPHQPAPAPTYPHQAPVEEETTSPPTSEESPPSEGPPETPSF